MTNMTNPTKDKLEQFLIEAEGVMPNHADEIECLHILIEKYGGAEPDGSSTVTKAWVLKTTEEILYEDAAFGVKIAASLMIDKLCSIGVNVVEGEEKHEHQD